MKVIWKFLDLKCRRYWILNKKFHWKFINFLKIDIRRKKIVGQLVHTWANEACYTSIYESCLFVWFCLSHWNFANKRCRRVSFIMFWPIVEKLLNIEQFCPWKSNEIIIKVLGEIGASFLYGYKALYEWDFLEVIL